MLSRALSVFLDPRFFFRPDTLVRAILRKVRFRPVKVRVKTAWGDLFDLNPHKMIGAHVYMRGVHELAVCEILARLVDRGETVADVGANIGIMSSLMSRLAGPEGMVYACEAHPLIVEELRQNVRLWGRDNIKILHAAISSSVGLLEISDSEDSHLNEGTAKVQPTYPVDVNSVSGRFRVPSTTLDKVVGDGSLAVLKVDVEGHEADVFTGAAGLLKEQRIRDIVFECPIEYPSCAHQYLLDYGYIIYKIESSLFSPRLVNPRKPSMFHGVTDFVATADPDRLLRRLAKLGWRALQMNRQLDMECK